MQPPAFGGPGLDRLDVVLRDLAIAVAKQNPMVIDRRLNRHLPAYGTAHAVTPANSSRAAATLLHRSGNPQLAGSPPQIKT